MHYHLILGILCWPVILMGQSRLPQAITLFPVRAGTETFYPQSPPSADSVFYLASSLRQGGSGTKADPLSLTLEQSLQRLNHTSPALRMSDQLVGMARAERERLRSFWYPMLQASGAYVHMSQSVEVRQSLKPYAQSAKEWLGRLLPIHRTAGAPSAVGNGSLGTLACQPELGAALGSGLSSWLSPAVSSLLDQLGSQTLAFPILSSNLTGVQAQLWWPVFTGGKRVYASRIGRRLVDGAEIHRSETKATLQARLVEAYYGLRLAQRVTEVRYRAWEGMQRHFQQAKRLEEEGMMNKADRLFVQVARDEARRAWETAVHQQDVALHALQVLLEVDESVPVHPASPLFFNESLPPVAYFHQLAGVGNYQANQLSLQESIANERVKMGRSDYLPTVALFGRQSLYTHHLPSHLLPRAWVGVGFSWNLFDGLRREGKIRRARCLRNTLHEGREQVLDELQVGIDRLYAVMQHAQDDVATLHSTIQLSSELLRIRRKSFDEGMATSSDVVDAETMLAQVQVAYLVAFYEYDVSLAALLSLCGIPETFWEYMRTGATEESIMDKEIV